ncbi:TPA: hypothetical protein ACJKEY_002094, partial [Neisseria meningitidis]
AFAGMTAEWFLLLPINAAISSLVIPLKQKTEIRNLKSRHSRAGGNLGLSVRKLVENFAKSPKFPPRHLGDFP